MSSRSISGGAARIARGLEPHAASSRARPRPESLSVFFRSLAVLFSSGVGIERSLLLLGDGTDDAQMAEVSRGIARAVRHGSPISAGMAAFPRAFDDMQVGLVEVGEGSGTLDHILERLGSYEERRRAVMLKLKSALTYPAFLAFFSLLLLVLVPPFLFNRALEVTRDSGVQPPLLTRVLMAYATMVQQPWFWPVLAGLLIAGWITLRTALAKPSVQLRVARKLPKVPGLGKVLENATLNRFAGALGLQMEAGVNPLLAVPLAVRATGNPLMIRDLDVMVEALKDGEPFHAAFSRCELFSAAFLQMVRVGEESGRLPELLDRLTRITERDLDQALSTFASLVEPAIMIVMGAIVALVVLATLMPMTMMLQKL